MFLKEIKIGNVKLNNNLILAPMAGITDLPFRTICEQFNPGMVCTEMVSSKALFYNDKKTKRLLDLTGEKRPISCQAFGSDTETMGYVAKYLSDIGDIVDINMGCPAPKVVKNGDGSKLLLNIELAEKIVKSVVKNSKVPVTLKMRTGWDNENIVAPMLAKVAEDVGVKAIIIHGRTRTQYYSGEANLDIIKQVKNSVNIPVIGNGDVVDGKSAKHMFEYTGVDGIMIGRGTLGSPWIFEQIKYYLETGNEMPEPNSQEKLKIIKKHIELVINQKGDIAVKELRKHIAWYTKKLKNSSEFRASINKIEDKEELKNKIEEYFCHLD